MRLLSSSWVSLSVASSTTKAAVPYRKLWIGATNLRMDKKREEGKEPGEKEREGSFKFKPDVHQVHQLLTTEMSAAPYMQLWIGATNLRMDKKGEEGKEPSAKAREAIVEFMPDVHQMQQLVATETSGGWEKCWEQGLTPWDLGHPTPIILHLHQTGALPKGRALVPGCGSGYDVVAMACSERYVVGLDVSHTATEKATELSSSLPNSSYLTFLKADFFTWHPPELFDLIFDYTFFCAIKPEMRSRWACKVQEMLKPDGELITLMYPISDHVGGPPYKVSVSDYEEVLHPLGFKAVTIVDNELAIGARKGREKLGRWRRDTNTLDARSSFLREEGTLSIDMNDGF